jgi:hypothetical protein
MTVLTMMAIMPTTAQMTRRRGFLWRNDGAQWQSDANTGVLYYVKIHMQWRNYNVLFDATMAFHDATAQRRR